MRSTFSSRQRLLLLAGGIGPLGYLPASGTVTVAVIGVPLFLLTRNWSVTGYLLSVSALAVASVWLHAVGDKLLGEKDSRRLVWDELVGFLLAVTGLPFTWRIALLALLVERAIDILKVPPARWIERRVPGGWGVVGDDVVAGVYSWLVLEAAVLAAPGWLGLSS